MAGNREMLAALDARLKRVEELLGTAPETSTPVSIFQRLSDVEMVAGNVHNQVEGMPSFVETRIASCQEETSGLTDAVDSKFEALNSKYEGILNDVNLLKIALRSDAADGRTASKVKVPEPKSFEGARSSKELENFLWDMETYFQAARIPNGEKVNITSMYLAGDAKLWWRARQSDDASANRERVETWDALKKELKDQFLPSNTSWLARDALRKLKHGGSVRSYVKEFSSLMLDIREMSDEDKLFNFMAGLQPWAQAELRRQAVQNLPAAIAAADRLVDYQVVGAPESSGESQNSEKGKGKDRGKLYKKDREQFEPKRGEATSQDPRKKTCYICEGDHLMRNCPKRKMLNTMRIEEVDDKGEEESIHCSALRLV